MGSEEVVSEPGFSRVSNGIDDENNLTGVGRLFKDVAEGLLIIPKGGGCDNGRRVDGVDESLSSSITEK